MTPLCLLASSMRASIDDDGWVSPFMVGLPHS